MENEKLVRDETEAIECLKSNKPTSGYLMLQEAIDIAIEALEEVQQYRAIGTSEECQKSVAICKSMIERNITPENMEEYMKFEDECVRRGFTFNSLLEAREKQTAKKPEFVDTRFMNNGKHISDGCQLQKCYKCPNCSQHIFHVWDDELYCKYCGQHIDWSDEE